MENQISTQHASRIIDWLIYGTRENEKKHLTNEQYNSSEERMKRFRSILPMKQTHTECDCGTRNGFAHCITCAVNK